MASPVPSDAVAAPLSCGACAPAPLLARLPRNALATPWRRLARALRREPINHASAPAGGSAARTSTAPAHPRWLPARLEHVLIHPWTTGLCCSLAIAESPRRRPPLLPITTDSRRFTCPNTP